MMNKRRHMIAAMMCVVMLIAIFVSSAYIAHEVAHPHDCTGEDCPICRFIAQIGQLRRGLGMALLALLLSCLAMAVGHTWHAWAISAGAPTLCTLVGRKIRLND